MLGVFQERRELASKAFLVAANCLASGFCVAAGWGKLRQVWQVGGKAEHRAIQVRGVFRVAAERADEQASPVGGRRIIQTG